MSTLHNQLFAPVILSDSTETLLITVPANYVLVAGVLGLVNDTASSVKVDLWAIPPAGSPAQANLFASEVLLDAKSSKAIQIPKVGAGYTIKGKADAASSVAATPLNGYYTSVS